MRPRPVAVVPHTHWDREWYSPFQTFRLRLVDLLDRFIPEMERDTSYAHFLLDGQMAVVEDYLEVRPEARAALQRLVASGRLAMGPWYILMDEFLVSGESIIRNLQRGLSMAEEFGGAMEVGYLPDMFGHVAQMPQILRAAGIEHAVVWRGVPAAVDRTGFWWSAPDGSTVRAEYLRTGYSNGAGIPDDAKALVRRLRTYEEEVESFLVGALLYMNGTDHEVPQPWLGRVVAEANDIQDDFELQVTSLASYLAAASTEGLPSWTGELRSGYRTHVLMGVASNRVDVKQAAARTERSLERLAEPLSALLLPVDAYPTALLDLAWREVLRNSAHDSICACSVDEVGAAVLHRYSEARQIADGLTDRALAHLGGLLPDDAVVVVNPSARRRGGLIEVNLPGEGPVEGAQVLWARPAVLSDETIAARELAALLGQIRGQQLAPDTFVNAIEVTDTDEGFDLVLHVESIIRANAGVDEAKRELYSRAKVTPTAVVRVQIEQPPSRSILTRADDVPGYGWAPFLCEPPTVEPVAVDDLTIANGLITVTVDAADGTFSIDGLGGMGRLVDSGDHGDTYNYSPPQHDTVVDAPESCRITTVERGPMRAIVEVRRAYRWPQCVDDVTGARGGDAVVEVRTAYEVQAGEQFVRVGHSFFNTCRDHRLRAVFPLPSAVVSSRAECAFGVVERGLDAEGGPMEDGLPTFPSRRFVQAGGLTVAHEGLLEYEVVDGGTALAVTLLRATGMLSRVEMSTRSVPAGPAIPTEGSQMIGEHSVRYVVARDVVNPYALVDDAFLPLLLVRSTGAGGETPASGCGLSVDGAEVSAVHRVDGELEVRVFNPTAEPTTVTIDGSRGWLVDLRGGRVAEFDRSFELDRWKIATVRLATPRGEALS